jgi:tRNA threonylcarbamoyladenosine biosynthesis protein TsaE
LGNKIVETKSATETIELGKRLGKLLQAGDAVALTGNLGSGKTTLTQGLARGLGVKRKDYVTSPSFTLIKEHKGRIPIYHIDLYRIDNIKEIFNLGYEEYFYGEGVAIIEWADKIKKLLPREVLIINLEIIGENRRKIELVPKGKHYRDIVDKLIRTCATRRTLFLR